MKAVAVQSFGGPESLALVDQPTPSPLGGEVLVRVQAAGVGLADTFLREGVMRRPELPFVPGLEMAGVVERAGDGVDPAWVGSSVFAQVEEGIKSGCYAEYVVVREGALVPLPSGVSAGSAVALGVNALVGKCITERAQLRPDDRVLVRGAGGGIGVMLTQFAARSGATVIAATSSPDRARRLLELGAFEVVDRSAAQIIASGDPSRSTTRPDGFDAILDPVAGPDLTSFTAMLRPNGRLVLAGVAGGFPSADFGMSIFSPRSPTYSMLSLDSLDHDDRIEGYREVFDLAAKGELQPVVHAVLPLEDARRAHEMLASGEVFGKIVLEMSH